MRAADTPPVAQFVSDSTKLKACPFCGADAQIEHGSDHHGAWFNLGCSRHWGSGLVDADDGCIGGRVYYTETETPEAEAIAAWNTRAAPPAMDREAVTKLAEQLSHEVEDWRHNAYTRVMLAQMRDRLSAILSTLSADAIRQGEGLKQQAHEWRRLEVQAIGAAISTRSWHAVEQAYNALRDKMDAAGCWHAPATPASHASDGGEGA